MTPVSLASGDTRIVIRHCVAQNDPVTDPIGPVVPLGETTIYLSDATCLSYCSITFITRCLSFAFVSVTMVLTRSVYG